MYTQEERAHNDTRKYKPRQKVTRVVTLQSLSRYAKTSQSSAYVSMVMMQEPTPEATAYPFVHFHLSAHPGSNARRSKATHVLQTGASHREIADKVPDQGGELEDGGDEGEEEVLELETSQ